MNICVVSPFFNIDKNISRPAFVQSSLRDAGHKVMVFTSNFSHQHKKKVNFLDENIKALPTLKYKSNVSVMRFISHFFLSFSLFYMVLKKRNEFDIFYVTAPFALTAFLIKVALNKRVVLDIVDFWPNSLPFPKKKLFQLLLYPWSRLNTVFCKRCDVVVSLSSEFLRLSSARVTQQIPFGAVSNFVEHRVVNSNKISVMYIGNVGVLYDFDSLLKVVSNEPEAYSLHIVGVGDKLNWLKKQLEDIGVDFTLHGAVYDREKLREIAQKCDIGFNGYIKTNASFSYKALSYFSLGLPIANSMMGDLYDYVDKYHLGFNYEQGSDNSLALGFKNYKVDNLPSKEVCVFFDKFLSEDMISNSLVKCIVGN